MYLFCFFVVGGGGWVGWGGSARVQIIRMCSLGSEVSRRTCLTSSGECTVIGYPSATLAGGVFTVAESCRDIFVLILADRGDALTTHRIFWTGAFFLTLVADTLEAAGAWVARQQLCGIGGGCHCWRLFKVGIV